ncbi:MAG: iron-sulfur cluster assembly protein IscA [Halieaceae bacterium]|nr:iron-sulfur cluster assembly protein IscA [Halieaceae bacterium]MCP4468240.1 iron-sulfur cluster assembly protein IscA [Halieaceae bacterium]MCP4842937.1 iron-sulfur cluster assembly protein IscA [Halieaceae bacterium]MDG2411120.1 iron-sulfur cluster assembly protein IscA [Halioglobus sp.]
MGVSLTESAAQHVAGQLTSRGKGLGIRLGVTTSGCSGMAYVLEFVDELQNEDLVFEDFGVKVFIDPKSLVYLEGTELDFVKEGLNEGLQFRNPNVSAECGCGESFTV